MNKPANIFILWMIFGVVFSPLATAEQPSIQIDLSRETHRRVTIAVSGFIFHGNNPEADKWGEKGREILENDLRLSELFLPVKPETYEPLARQEAGKPKIDYQSWDNLGIQWVIKTGYQVNPKNKGLIFVFRLYDAVNDRFLVGRRYRGNRSILRRIMHRFADEVVAQLTGKPGVANTRIAFVSAIKVKQRNGKEKIYKEIYTVDFDGHNVKRLSNEKALVMNRARKTDENKQSLVESVVMNPAWSPDGRRLLFNSYAEGNPDLMLIDFSTKRRWSILQLPGLNAAPAWSPDGTKIALVLSKDGNSEIYVLNDKSKLNRLTHHFNIDTSPTWSPDGKKIAFASDRSGTGAPQIYIMDAEAGDRKIVRRISFSSTYNDNPAWSPDGDKIAYTSRISRKFQIKIFDEKTNKTEVFTSGPGSGEKPSWSPDGNFIVYKYAANKKSNLYIKRIGGGKARQLTFLDEGGFHPAWSPYLK